MCLGIIFSPVDMPISAFTCIWIYRCWLCAGVSVFTKLEIPVKNKRLFHKTACFFREKFILSINSCKVQVSTTEGAFGRVMMRDSWQSQTGDMTLARFCLTSL